MEERQIPKVKLNIPKLRTTKMIDFTTFDLENKANSLLKQMEEARATLQQFYLQKEYEKIEKKTEEYLSLFYGFFFPVETIKKNVEEKIVREKILVSEGGEQFKESTPLLSSNSYRSNNDEIDINQEKYSKYRWTFPFKWSSSLSTSEVEIMQSDSLYEVYCILYNYAIAIWNLLPKDKKSSFKGFLKIAGIFEFLENLFDELTEKEDIKKSITTSLKLISLCEAKEIAVEIGYEKEENFEKFSGIVVELSNNYQEIITLLKNIDGIKELNVHVSYKKKYFDLLSILFSGICYNETQENGNALSLLYEGKKQFDDFQKLSKLQENDNIQKQVKWLDRFIKKYIDKFEQQNKLVFHDKIPDNQPSLMSCKTIGKPMQFEFPKANSAWKSDFYEYLNFPKYVPEDNEKFAEESDFNSVNEEKSSSKESIKKEDKQESKIEKSKENDGIGGCGLCIIS
eukprot:gene8437-263_t